MVQEAYTSEAICLRPLFCSTMICGGVSQSFFPFSLSSKYPEGFSMSPDTIWDQSYHDLSHSYAKGIALGFLVPAYS